MTLEGVGDIESDIRSMELGCGPRSPKGGPRAVVTALAAVLLATAAGGCVPDDTGTGAGTGSKEPSATGPAGSALTAVDSLTVKGRAPKTRFDRDEFGSPWVDTDSNGCGTRDDVLKRDLKDVRFKAGDEGCSVASGTLAPDPYTGEDIAFVRGRSPVDIDHLVALSDAWQKGARQWDASKRIALANDLMLAV